MQKRSRFSADGKDGPDMLFLNLLILVAGFAALIKGSDLFVDGSAALARNFRVPALIIGLTIVAMGTSAPELAVSTVAAIEGANEISVSNVLGSNLCNLLLVLGLSAVIRPIPVDKSVLKKDFPVSVVPTAALFLLTGGLCLLNGTLFQMNMSAEAGVVSRPIAFGLLAVFAVYMYSLFRSARKHRQDEAEQTDPAAGEKTYTNRKCALLIVIGLVLIIGGGQAVVYSAREIARALGMTETMIGLTVVALGTSLPELFTSVMATRKGETELAFGNVLGSNIFNLLLILGVSAAIKPVGVNAASVWDMLIVLVTTCFAWICGARGKRINRAEGIIMVVVYFATMVFAVVR